MCVCVFFFFAFVVVLFWSGVFNSKLKSPQTESEEYTSWGEENHSSRL